MDAVATKAAATREQAVNHRVVVDDAHIKLAPSLLGRLGLLPLCCCP
jgi:hypothetical protein